MSNAAFAASTLALVILSSDPPHHKPDPPHHKPDPTETENITADAVTGPAALSGEKPETRKMDCRQISAGEFICKLKGAENASNAH